MELFPNFFNYASFIERWAAKEASIDHCPIFIRGSLGKGNGTIGAQT
jgi:hypothetical protein